MAGSMSWFVTTLGYLMVTTVIILVAVICGYALYIQYVRGLYKHIPGPPVDNFFLGHIPHIRRMHKLGEVLTKRQYLKAGVVYNRLYYTCGERFLGNGLVTNIDHEAWSKRRTAIDPAFHKRYLRSLMHQFNDMSDGWITQLNKLADGDIMITMADHLYRVTLDVIGKVAFNMDIGAVFDEQSIFPSSLNQILVGFSAQLRDPLLQMKPSKTNFVKDVRKAAKYLRRRARETIMCRISDMNAGRDVPDDILTFMIRSAATDTSLSTEDLVDDFMTIFIAGQETTSNSLAFLLNEVGRNPAVLQRLQEEVDDVLQDKQFISYQDTTKLEYMSQVWKETLRLYPPAPGTARENPTDCYMDGFFIPKNSFITVSFFVNHRLSSNYINPEHFDPDRFKVSQSGETPPHFLSFSLGPRSCAGKQFAQIEAKVLLAKFLQHFTFDLDCDQSYDVLETTTLRPRDGTRLTLHRRESTAAQREKAKGLH